MAGLLAACGVSGGNSRSGDPCAGTTTCVRLDVDGVSVQNIDQLELDLVYEGHHATTTTGTAGDTVHLPIAVPLRFDLSTPLVHLDLVVAGRLRGSLIGAAATTTTVQQGTHGSVLVFLEPVDPCVEGQLYCGLDTRIHARFDTIYRCTGGIPIYYAQCGSSCYSTLHTPPECLGLGTCRDGGTYCGGHVLDGDPTMLYVCSSLEGVTPVSCSQGCVVRGDGIDACL